MSGPPRVSESERARGIYVIRKLPAQKLGKVAEPVSERVLDWRVSPWFQLVKADRLRSQVRRKRPGFVSRQVRPPLTSMSSAVLSRPTSLSSKPGEVTLALAYHSQCSPLTRSTFAPSV